MKLRLIFVYELRFLDCNAKIKMEWYLYDMDVKQIRPVGAIEEEFSLRDHIQNSILIGERHGKKCDGFDYGNSPSSIKKKDVEGKTIIHTTSAGTQGIINAVHASEIITGSLVNARAVAEYIIARQDIFPEADFYMCIEYNKFSFVITIEKDEMGYVANKEMISFPCQGF